MQIEYEFIGRHVILADINAHIAHLEGLDVAMVEAMAVVHEATRQWHESRGEGSWPRLSRDTIYNKVAQGAGEPARPLYLKGNLFESVTSPSGPYSFVTPLHDGIAFGVDHVVRGYQIPEVLSEGSKATYRNSGLGSIPTRPIWPPISSAIGMAMMEAIGEIILRGTTTSPAFPGASVGRGAGGRFVSLR